MHDFSSTTDRKIPILSSLPEEVIPNPPNAMSGPTFTSDCRRPRGAHSEGFDNQVEPLECGFTGAPPWRPLTKGVYYRGETSGSCHERS